MEEIKRGSCVTLKSGGPVMVVTDVTDGMCQCRWFTADNGTFKEEFHQDVLCHLPPDNPAPKTVKKK